MIRYVPQCSVRLQDQLVKINNELEMLAGGRLREAHTHTTASSAAHLMVLDRSSSQSIPCGGCTRGLSVGVKMNVGTRAGRGREYCDQSAKNVLLSW